MEKKGVGGWRPQRFEKRVRFLWWQRPIVVVSVSVSYWLEERVADARVQTPRLCCFQKCWEQGS